MTRLRLIGSIVFTLLSISLTSITAQTTTRPMVLPVAGEPGASSWLFGQAYGNTTGAYNFGEAWYSAGQGLHFGVDFAMPCGTQLVAVADGEVAFVDNLSFGAGPHNLILRHPDLGVTTLYGHLLNPPTLVQGQTVNQGDVIGLSGDPDISCDSRPHLHFEVRSTDYRVAYNPVNYIDANWHSLASVGAYGYPLFQQDMDHARRWMSLEDQPNVAFGGNRLNNYAAVWPLPRGLSAPDNPPMPQIIPSSATESTWQLRQIGFDGCCATFNFHPTDADRLTVVDGQNAQRAAVFAWSAQNGMMTDLLYPAPPIVTSPDGTHQIFNNGSTSLIRDTLSGVEYTVNTGGATPAISTDNSKLVWTVRQGAILPGAAAPSSAVWVNDINGANARELFNIAGASAQWLDADRLLIRVAQLGRVTSLSVYDTRDDSTISLGAWRNVRGLTVSPGGGHLMFILMWQGTGNSGDPTTDGVYLLATETGAQAQRLPWFGGWRWRDAESVYYLPLLPESPYHTLAHYNVATGEDRVLIEPSTLAFTIMNGNWDVAADGQRIVFQNALDDNMWLLETVE